MTKGGDSSPLGSFRTHLLWKVRETKDVWFSARVQSEIQKAVVRHPYLSVGWVFDNAKTTLVIGSVIGPQDASRFWTSFTVRHRFEQPVPLEMTLRCKARYSRRFFVEVTRLWLRRK